MLPIQAFFFFFSFPLFPNPTLRFVYLPSPVLAYLPSLASCLQRVCKELWDLVATQLSASSKIFSFQHLTWIMPAHCTQVP